MKSGHRVYGTLPGRMLLVGTAILFTLCAGPAYSASEPGTVTIVLAGEPANVDPGDSTTSIHGQVLSQNVVETLAEISPVDSSLSPRLATAWKQIDANTWRFTLRKGVKFHDGLDFNAEALLFNIKRLYEPRIELQTRSKYFGNLKMEGKAVDNYTVDIKTSRPEPLLPTLVGVWSICSPNTPLDKWTRSPIGTGPYRFAKWDAGQQIVLERFDGYWGKQPQVKKAIYIWRSESSVRASMVEIGEADLTPNIAKQDAKRPDLDKTYVNGETLILRSGGPWVPPWNDKRFRMALNYAIDRDAIRGSILSKDAIPAAQLIGPSIFGYNPDLKPWPYDPKKARQLLDEARKDGVPVDKEILMVGRIAHFPGAEELLETEMTMLRAVGLNVKIKMVEAAASRPYDREPWIATGGPYIYQKQHGNSIGDPAFTAYFNYACKGYSSMVCDKTVDDLIAKAEVATGEQRRTLWRALFKRVHEEIVPDVELFHMVAYARVGKRISYRPTLLTAQEIQLAHITFNQ